MPEDNDEYLQELIKLEKWEWKEAAYENALPGIIVLQNTGHNPTDVERSMYTNETFKYMDRVNTYLSKNGYKKRELSINDFGNSEITKEVEDYIKSKNAYTFYSSSVIRNKSYFKLEK